METWLLIVIIVAAVLVIGVVVWFLFFMGGDEEAVVQVVDLATVKEIEVKVGEVAYGTFTVDIVEDASVLVGDCDALTIEQVTAEDLPATEEEEGAEEEAAPEGEEEEESRRLREDDEEEEAATTETFYYSLTGAEEGSCKLLMVYTAAADVDLADEETWPAKEEMQVAAVEVTVVAGEEAEGEEAAEGEGDAEEGGEDAEAEEES